WRRARLTGGAGRGAHGQHRRPVRGRDQQPGWPCARSGSMNPESPISPTRRIYWSVRREVWENRSIYLAPLAVAAVILAGFLISIIRLPAKMRAAALDPVQQHHVIAQPYV